MFKTGKFYAFQGQRWSGEWMYLYSETAPRSHAEKLRMLAKNKSVVTKASRTTGLGSLATRYSYGDFEEDEERYSPPGVQASSSPYDLPLTNINTKLSELTDRMRTIRNNCSAEGINPLTIRLVIVDCGVEVFKPEPESDDAVEMRKFVLEKLSQEEKDLLKVAHWDVYHKLGDRSMLPDDDEDEK
jgi:uncharacterized UBP type Zn finger protein